MSNIVKSNTAYQITDCGKVYSVKSKKYLKPFGTGKVGKKYLCVQIKGKTIPLHRLVAEAFIANPQKKPFVNHIDGNRLNNNVSNLEWCTHKENMQHAQSMGLNIQHKGEKHGGHKLSDNQVKDIRNYYSVGFTLKQLSFIFLTSISNIHSIVTFNTRTTI